MKDAVNRLSGEIQQLRDELEKDAKILRKQRRRGRIILSVLFVIAVYVAITLHDEHIVHCYPPDTKQEQAWCNRVFFLHDHPLEP